MLSVPPQCRDLFPTTSEATRALSVLCPQRRDLARVASTWSSWTVRVLDEDWTALVDLPAHPWEVPY